MLLEERRRHPRWGPRKLLVLLRERHPEWPWPAVSTAGEILKRNGLVVPRRRRQRNAAPGKPVVEAKEPNEVWTADYKGEFRLGDGQLCYPLTVVDLRSRFLLCCEGKASTAGHLARTSFERLFEQYGLPEMILTDSGSPFASPLSLRRLSRLSVWWIRLGIEPVLIQPAHPEQNGCHERMHRTLKDATARPPAEDMDGQQRLFDEFRIEYNTQRPHEALGLQRPASFYRRSSRSFPGDTPELSYPGHYSHHR